MDSAHCYGYHRKDSATSIRMRGYFRAGAVARSRAFFFFFFRPRARAFSRRASLARRGGAPPEAAHLRLQYQGLSSTHSSESAISYGWRSDERAASRVKVRRPPAARPRKTERKPPSGDSGRPAAQAPTKGDRGGGRVSDQSLGLLKPSRARRGWTPPHIRIHTPSWRRITSPLRRPARNCVRSRARAAKRGPVRFFLLLFLVRSFGQTHRKGARARARRHCAPR